MKGEIKIDDKESRKIEGTGKYEKRWKGRSKVVGEKEEEKNSVRRRGIKKRERQEKNR